MQRLNHHHLYIFWTFAKTGSFTKAARDLSIAQSAVTSQIKSLENVLDLQLVDRTNPRYPELTAEGKKVLEYAESIFETSRELINWATQGSLPKEKVIRIGALSGLSRNLQYEFMKPGLKDSSIHFSVTTGDQSNLVEKLKSHDLDVILSSHNVKFEKGPDFQSHVLTSSPVIFVIRKDQAHKKSKKLEDYLAQYPLFIPGHHFEARPELEAFLSRFKIKLNVAGEIDDIALLRILALRSGHLVGLPEMGIRNDLSGGSVAVVGKATQVEQKFYAITRSRLRPSDEVRFMIDSIRKI